MPMPKIMNMPHYLYNNKISALYQPVRHTRVLRFRVTGVFEGLVSTRQGIV
jgi:hypothetical protein